MVSTETQFAQYASRVGGFAAQSHDLILEPTLKTPYVNYSKLRSTLVIKGRSTDENISRFYAPIVSILKSHLEGQKSIRVDLLIQEMNTDTLKVLFDLFKYFNLKKLSGKTIEVIWRSSLKNHAMYETGYDFCDLYDLDIKVITE